MQVPVRHPLQPVSLFQTGQNAGFLISLSNVLIRMPSVRHSIRHAIPLQGLEISAISSYRIDQSTTL